MDLVPLRQRSSPDLWNRFRHWKGSPELDRRNRSASITLCGLGLLNLPLFFACERVKYLAIQRAEYLFEAKKSRLFYRVALRWFPSLGPRFIALYTRLYGVSPFLRRYALGNLSGGQWWTTFTASFLQTEREHLISNLFGLWQIWTGVASVRGIHALHLVVLTAYTSIMCSVLESLYMRTRHPFRSWAANGFSGIVCAFLGLATVGARQSRRWILFSFVTWFGSDVYRLFQGISTGLQLALTADKVVVGHRAHLASMVCGIVYYLSFLAHLA